MSGWIVNGEIMVKIDLIVQLRWALREGSENSCVPCCSPECGRVHHADQTGMSELSAQ